MGRAEILVAAIGKAELVRGEWVREGAVVIDVGHEPARRTASSSATSSTRAAARRAAAITPVPGGVGPMTRAMLLVNTVELARGRVR